MRRSRAFPRLALVGGLLALGAPFLGGGAAQADAGYEALASATGVRVIFSNQTIPLGVSPQLQGPTAQAKQTSLQQSDAYAAFPFPGEEVAGLPGVAGGALGVAAPAYPFLVTSAFGDDVRRLSYPGLELSATSGESITEASATGGSTGAGATSIARIVREGQEIRARASVDADGIRLGEALVINGLRAVATAARDGNGKLTRTSTLSFSSISAPGLALTIPTPPSATGPGQKLNAPEIGFTDGTFTLTVPGADQQRTPVPTEDVLGAFAAAGYTITYQAPQDTADGIIGAGLQIATTLPAPPEGSPGGLSGQTPVTLSLGLARAEISYTAAAAPTGTGEVALIPPVAAIPPVPPPAALPDSQATQPVTIGSVPAQPAPGALLPERPAVDLARLTALREPLNSDLGWLYLMLAAAGVLGVGAIAALRVIGAGR